MINNKKKIAIYDFDGTLTTRSSFTDFLKFQKGKKGAFVRFLANLPAVLTLGTASMKEKIFGLFFKGMEEKVFEKLCGEFCEKRLTNIVKKEIYEIFLKDLKEQDMVIIASASLEDYLLPFFKKYDEKVTVVGTKIEKKNGIITGRFVGKNCSKSEKVKRIIEVAYLGDAQVTIYTDGYNDEPLMSMGGEIHLTK